MKVYLSPSNQKHNACAYGDTEADHCPALAQKIKLYLELQGVECRIRNPSHTISTNMKEAEAWGADLYLPLHTNGYSKPEVTRSCFGYSPDHPENIPVCETFIKRWKILYPRPDKVKLAKYANFGEANRAPCPTTYIELVFHSNPADAEWMHGHMEQCAENLAMCACDALQIPYMKDGVDMTMYGTTIIDDPVYPVLQRGRKDFDETGNVHKLQKLLVANGFALPKHGVDGDFGEETEGAVFALQTKMNVWKTGIVTEAVWRWLQEAHTEPPVVEPEQTIQIPLDTLQAAVDVLERLKLYLPTN